jgi:hypothetical protein
LKDKEEIMIWNARWKKTTPAATAPMNHAAENINAVNAFITTERTMNFLHASLMQIRNEPMTAQ